MTEVFTSNNGGFGGDRGANPSTVIVDFWDPLSEKPEMNPRFVPCCG